MHVARLGALGRVSVTGNFDQQRAHGRAELGLEEQIQNLAALRFGIILEQNRGGAAAAHRADAVEAFAAGIALEINGLVRKRRRKTKHQTDHQGYKWFNRQKTFGICHKDF